MVSLPFCFPVINGVITADSSGITPQLPDVSLTNPVNIGYLVSIIDPLTGINILGSGYTIQPTGAAFDFDTYEPNLDDMVTMPLKLLAGTGITITQSGSTYTISLS
jgi:hypothetical protein